MVCLKRKTVVFILFINPWGFFCLSFICQTLSHEATSLLLRCESSQHHFVKKTKQRWSLCDEASRGQMSKSCSFFTLDHQWDAYLTFFRVKPTHFLLHGTVSMCVIAPPLSFLASPPQDMWWGTLGTVRPFSNFHPDQDAMEIQAALDRKGASRRADLRPAVLISVLISCELCSDAGTLVNLLTNRNNAQRQVIAVEYKKMTNKVKPAVLNGIALLFAK